MKLQNFKLDYFWSWISFILFGAGSFVMLCLLIFSNDEYVEDASKSFGIFFMIIWALLPFGFKGRMERYFSVYTKKGNPKILLILFLLESFLLYGNYIFCGFFLLPIRANIPISYLLLKIIAGGLSVSLIVLLFLQQKRKFGSK